MDNNDQPDKPSSGKQVNNYLRFSGMGIQMAVIIGLFTFAGLKIDAASHHSTKWVTAILSLAGVFISLYIVIRSLKTGD